MRRERQIGQAQAVGANTGALEDQPLDGLTVAGHRACIGGSGGSSICSLASLPYRLSAKQQGRKQDPRDLEVCGASADETDGVACRHWWVRGG